MSYRKSMLYLVNLLWRDLGKPLFRSSVPQILMRLQLLHHPILTKGLVSYAIA